MLTTLKAYHRDPQPPHLIPCESYSSSSYEESGELLMKPAGASRPPQKAEPKQSPVHHHNHSTSPHAPSGTAHKPQPPPPSTSSPNRSQYQSALLGVITDEVISSFGGIVIDAVADVGREGTASGSHTKPSMPSKAAASDITHRNTSNSNLKAGMHQQNSRMSEDRLLLSPSRQAKRNSMSKATKLHRQSSSRRRRDSNGKDSTSSNHSKGSNSKGNGKGRVRNKDHSKDKIKKASLKRASTHGKPRSSRYVAASDMQTESSHSSHHSFTQVSYDHNMSPNALADLYYSHIAGEDPSESFHLDNSDHHEDTLEPCVVGNPSTVQDTATEEQDDMDNMDLCSFAELDLEALIFGSAKDIHPSAIGTSSHHTAMLDNSGDGLMRSTDFCATQTQEGMRLSEVRAHVMSSVPNHLLKHIPEEAWEEIFEATHSGTSKLSSNETMSSKPSNESFEPHPMDCLAIDGIKDKHNTMCHSHRRAGATSASTYSQDASNSNNNHTNDDDDDDDSVATGMSSLTDAFEPLTDVEEYQLDHPVPTSPSHDAVVRPSTRRGSLKEVQDPFKPQSTATRTTIATLSSHRTSPRAAAPKKRVSFGDVTIRHYRRILSDNPSCYSGPSIGIGWKYRRAGDFTVDDWERRKPVPRKPSEMIMPREERTMLVMELGYDPMEVADAIRRKLRLQNRRKQTIQNLNAAPMEEAIENVKQRIRSVLKFATRKRLIKSNADA